MGFAHRRHFVGWLGRVRWVSVLPNSWLRHRAGPVGPRRGDGFRCLLLALFVSSFAHRRDPSDGERSTSLWLAVCHRRIGGGGSLSPEFWVGPIAGRRQHRRPHHFYQHKWPDIEGGSRGRFDRHGVGAARESSTFFLAPGEPGGTYRAPQVCGRRQGPLLEPCSLRLRLPRCRLWLNGPLAGRSGRPDSDCGQCHRGNRYLLNGGSGDGDAAVCHGYRGCSGGRLDVAALQNERPIS